MGATLMTSARLSRRWTGDIGIWCTSFCYFVHFFELNFLLRESIDLLKENFRDELKKDGERALLLATKAISACVSFGENLTLDQIGSWW
jgi:hypothetical protein